MSEAGRIENTELDMLGEIKRIEREDGFVNPTNRVIRISARADSVNWGELRKHFILGKRKQLEDGTWVSEDYTYRELCAKFSTPACEIKYNTMKKVASQQTWSKYRKAYLARVNQINIGQELGLYTQENYQAQIAAINACNKLGTVLDKFIEYKFGDILEMSEDVTDDGTEVPEEISNQMREVNRATGTPVLLAEIKDAVKVVTDIYNLQQKIYKDAPKGDAEIIEELSTKPRFRTEQERHAAIARLEAQLGRSLSQVKQEREMAEAEERRQEDLSLKRKIRYRQERGLPLDDLGLDAQTIEATVSQIENNP